MQGIRSRDGFDLREVAWKESENPGLQEVSQSAYLLSDAGFTSSWLCELARILTLGLRLIISRLGRLEPRGFVVALEEGDIAGVRSTAQSEREEAGGRELGSKSRA